MAIFDRRSLLLGAIVLAFTSPLGAVATPPPKILLVCQFGTVKSPIARELLRRRAAERHIGVEVTARGITPQQHISAELLSRLAKEGINPAAEPLRKLGPSDVSAADLVIAFDKLPADYRPRRFEDWSDLPSMLSDYDHARSVLDARIDKLLDALSVHSR
jgi:protein-tyrosine-phosphatase